MYGELASIRDVVDLSPEDALASAEGFLTRLGYATLLRDETSITVKREETGRPADKVVLNLKVVAHPQPEGGVLITVLGNDREGVREHQAQWGQWAESLPKKGARQPP